MTYLDRLIARATGHLPVPGTAPALAQELDHPAYAEPLAEEHDAVEPAALTPKDAGRPTPSIRARQARARDEAQSADQPAAPIPPARPQTDALPPVAFAPNLVSTQAPEAVKAPAPPAQFAGQPIRPSKPASPHTAPQPRPASPLPGATEQPQPPARTEVASQLEPVTPASALAQSPVAAAPHTPPPEALSDPLSPPPQAETIEIHLDIGRIDLVSPQPAPARSHHARPGPLLSLRDYLDQRRGSR